MTTQLRVLWLTPIKFASSNGGLSQDSGGWIEGWRWALEKYCPNVELGILAYGPPVHEPFKVGNATYFSFKTDALGKYRGLGLRWSHSQGLGDSEKKAFDEAVAIFQPDIIHVHGSESSLATLCATSRLPAVLSLQGIAAVHQRFMFSGQTWRDVVQDSASVRFLKGYGYAHSYLSMRNRAATEWTILNETRYVLGNTDWDRRVATLLCPAAMYYHGDRAMRREFYGPEWEGRSSGDPVIYCTSGQAPYKGLEILLHATALLRRTGFPNLHVRIAGVDLWGANGIALRRVIRQLRLASSVSLLGVIDAHQIVSELRAATLFVLPSHIENESNALIEAMLVGTPCVASAVGGVPSMLRDRADGLLYQDRDPFSLAGAARQLIVDPDFSASLAASGRAEARRRHDPATVADQLVEVYADILARTGTAT